jgi:hypothetical protein
MELLKITSVLIVFSTLVTAQVVSPPSPGRAHSAGASVTIHVVDEYGATVNCRVYQFFRRGHYNDPAEMVSRFRGLHGTDIPQDMYLFTLKRPGPGTMEDEVAGSVMVDSPEVFVVVPVRRHFIPGGAIDIVSPTEPIRGRLEPPPSDQQGKTTWIRLSPIYQKDRLDVSVDADGKFRIYDLLSGRYILSVIRGDEVLHIQEVEFEDTASAGELVVKVPEKPPATLVIGR